MQYNHTTQQIIDRLENKDIDYEIFEHEPVTTSEEAADARGDFSLGQGLKALVIKRYGADPEPHGFGASKDFAMIFVPGDTNFDQDKVEDAVGADDFRFANEDELDGLLGGVEVGGIPPMGSLFDLKTFADESINNMDEVIFNAGNKRVSIAMNADDYAKVEKLIGVNIAE
jgi:prolyl-tRNA editing enzyme YbaK/EbsC (Cys-tRNA(Pro) deacylase)